MLLAIDTASRFMSIALHDGQTLRAEQTHYTNNQHTVQLAVMIKRLLDDSELNVGDLTCLALSQGPGSFSGLRIGFSMAKGLAAARKLPLIAVPTLDVIAYATPFFDGVLVAAVQAGRGRIIAGRYQWSGQGWQAQGLPEITSWEKLLEIIESGCLINGEIDETGYALAKNKAVICDPVWRLRRAGFLAELAWRRCRQGDDFGDPAAVNPVYLKGAG